MYFFIGLILFITLVVYVYKSNENGIPANPFG